MNCFIQETYRPIENFIANNHTITGFVIFNIVPYLVQIFQIYKTLQTAEVFSVFKPISFFSARSNYYPDFNPIDFFMPIFEVHINGLKLYALFWIWLLSLNVMFTKITLLHVAVVLSFSLMIFSYKCFLFTLSLIDI